MSVGFDFAIVFAARLSSLFGVVWTHPTAARSGSNPSDDCVGGLLVGFVDRTQVCV